MRSKKKEKTKQYTRSLDSRLSSLETQVRRASQRSDGGIRDTTHKKSPKKFIKSSDDSKEEFPNSEDEGDPSPSAYIGTMAQQAQKWVSQVTIQIQESVYKDVFTVFDSGSDYNCVRADLIPIISGNDVRRKPKLLMGQSYLLHGSGLEEARTDRLGLDVASRRGARIEVESLPFTTSLELFLHALGEAKGLLSFLIARYSGVFLGLLVGLTSKEPRGNYMLSKLGKEAGYRSDGGGHSSLLGPLRGPPLIYLRGTRHPAGSSLALPGGSGNWARSQKHGVDTPILLGKRLWMGLPIEEEVRDKGSLMTYRCLMGFLDVVKEGL
ncbi:hypothetical protein Droror1_Dr00028279 [Drosera rotundifolia]